MRFLPLLLLFVSLACCGRIEVKRRPTVRQLVYRYDVQLVTGAPQSSKLTSGLRLIGNLHLNIVRRWYRRMVYAKLENVNIYKLDKFVEQHSAMQNLLPDDTLLDGIEVDVNQTMIEALKLPFMFRWSRGQVRNVRFHEEDPIWSVNVKRGAISLLVVNLDKTFSILPQSNKDEQQGDRFIPRKPSYTVWEDTPVGYCLTTYTPVTPMYKEQKGFYLTKVRQYDSCLSKAPMTYVFDNFMSRGKPQNGEESLKHLNVQGGVSYSIQGNRVRFTILTAIGQSKIIFMPWGPHDGSVHTSINQTLVLKVDKMKQLDRVEIRQRSRLVSKSVYDPTLKMELPVQAAQDQFPYVIKRTGVLQEPLWTKDKMKQLLTWVTNGTYAYPSEEVLMTTETLMDMIRQSTNDTLRKLLKDLENSDHQLVKLKMKILWDLLSKAGTTSATNVVVEKCIDAAKKQSDLKLPKKSCVSAIMSIGLYTMPSQQVIEQLIELLLVSRAKERIPGLTQVTLLALGSVSGRLEDMANDILNKKDQEYDAEQQILCANTANGRKLELKKCLRRENQRRLDLKISHQKLQQKVLEAILPEYYHRGELLKKMENDNDAAAVIGALRNAHIPTTEYLLMYVVRSTQLSSIIRILAIQALETFRNETRESVREIVKCLELIQKNPTESGTIRIQAFRSMINLGMSTPTLIRIASSIASEEETPVSTYIWSTLNQLANTTFAPYKLIASQARAALPFMKPVQVGIQESQRQQILAQLANNATMLKELNHITDRKMVTIIDHAAYFDIFGTTNKAVQVSLIAEGLPKLLSDFLGPRGFFTRRHSMFDLFKRMRRDVGNVQHAIKLIAKQLGIKAREIPEIQMLLSMQMYNKVVRIGNLTDLIDINESGDETIMVKDNESKLKDGISFAYQTAGMAGQWFVEVPTECGLPVSLDLGLLYSANVTGEVSSQVDPSIFKQKRGNRPPEAVSGRLAIQPEVVGSLMGRMSADGYLFKAGTMFQVLANLNSPLCVSAVVNVTQRRLSVALSPPVSPTTPVLKLALKSYVYSTAVANQIPKEDYLNKNINKKPIFNTLQAVMISNGAQMVQSKTSFGERFLGFDVALQGQRVWGALPSSTSPPLLGRWNYAMYIRPGISQPPAIKLDVVSFSSSLHKDLKDPEVEINNQSMPNLPRFNSILTLKSLKGQIEHDLGVKLLPAPHVWGLVAKLDTSSEKVSRAMSLAALFQSWQHGYVRDSYVAVYRTPIPAYDHNPWMMWLKSRTIFPKEKITVSNLMNPRYQQQANRDALALSQQSMANQFFQQQLFTSVNNYAMQRLPSQMPQVIVDRILPEYVLQGDLRNITKFLRHLLPICHQLKELKSRLKDEFQKEKLKDLLVELKRKTFIGQRLFIRYLKDLGRSGWLISPAAAASVEYVVLKFTQAVLDFNAILDWNESERLNRQQALMQTASKNALTGVTMKLPGEFNNLSLLLKKQLEDIETLWHLKKLDLAPLISETTQNIAEINQLIKEIPVPHNKSLVGLLLRAAEQHLVIMQTLSHYRYTQSNISDFDHYALKVQGKELQERATILLQQFKMQLVCSRILPTNQRIIMVKLQHVDRLLMAIQQDNVELPSKDTPWTGSSLNLVKAERILEDAVLKVEALSDQLEKQPEQTVPCLLNKLVDTTATLQQKVSIFKRILLAQSYRPKLTVEYEQLDDRTMRLVLSLNSLFNKRVPPYAIMPDPIQYNTDDLVVTKVQLGLEKMRGILQAQKEKLNDAERGVDDLRSKIAQDFFQDIFEGCRMVQDRLVQIKEKVKFALAAAGSESEVMDSFSDVIIKLNSLYNALNYVLQGKDSEDAKSEIMKKTTELAALENEIESFDVTQYQKNLQQPIDVPHILSPKAPYMNDEDEHMKAFGYKEPDNDSSSSQISEDDISKWPNMTILPVQGVSFVANITFWNSNNSLAIKILARKSLPQRLWEQAQYFPESRDTCVANAVKGTLIGRPKLDKCIIQTEMRLNTYNHVHVAVQALWKMPEILTKGMDKLMTKMFVEHYDRSTVMAPMSFVNQNSLHAILDFAQPLQAVNRILMTPEETLLIESVPVSYDVVLRYPFQNLGPLSKVAALKASKGKLPGMCVLKPNVVRTADGLNYEVPFKQNEVSVLAMDCSSDPAFVIQTTAVRQKNIPSHSQEVRILGEEHEVKLIPGNLTVKVEFDNKELNLTDGYVQMKYDVYSRPVPAVVITSESYEGPIRVEYPLLGLDILYSSDTVSVEMSEVYQYKLCGLCGNFDYQITKELEGPEGRHNIYYSPKMFYDQYTLPISNQTNLFPAAESPESQ